ncbi:S8 family serine peptidase [Sphingomonas sp. WKB10]|nr:S8 family serine peptidase [Sphingomonas sp. WKB10]
MVGRSGAFHGAMPGAGLLVADVYGGSASNGSAVAIVRAMAWLAQNGAQVVNISLVGPPNPLLAAGIRALTAKGIRVVAAVGNDGPAAPPQYPASYPDVIAVTGVDAKGKALMEAGKPLHLDYAAPGADMVGAVPGGGWEVLRGTSFAAPSSPRRSPASERPPPSPQRPSPAAAASAAGSSATRAARPRRRSA